MNAVGPVQARTRQVAAGVVLVAALHAALLALWPGRAPHASSAHRAPAITLVAVNAPPVAAGTAANQATDEVTDEATQSTPGPAPVARPRAIKAPKSPPAAPAVDMVAQPRSAPDIAMLQGLPFSGLPMRVRLTIDSVGHVVDVAVLRSMDDAVVNEAVRRMFLATAFVPARRDGVDAASVQDIEISLADLR